MVLIRGNDIELGHIRLPDTPETSPELEKQFSGRSTSSAGDQSSVRSNFFPSFPPFSPDEISRPLPDLDNLSGNGSGSGSSLASSTSFFARPPSPDEVEGSKWKWLFLSKIVPFQTSIRRNPDGFIVGVMRHAQFCQWVDQSPPAIRNAVVRDITWWRKDLRPFNHQFIVVTVDYQSHNAEGLPVSTLYDIRFERGGKLRGWRRRAYHPVTITLHDPLSRPRPDCTLLFGLLDSSLDMTPHYIPTGPPDPQSRYHISFAPAFRHPLDTKWRGSLPTLWQMHRYINIVVSFAPHYDLGSSNCYYFARSLFHIVALRHYCFLQLASSNARCLQPRIEKDDPSGNGVVLSFVSNESANNGYRLYRYTSSIAILVLVGVYIALLVKFSTLHIPHEEEIAITTIPLILIGILVGMIGMSIVSTIRRAYERIQLLQMIEKDPNLNPHPTRRQGWYTRAKILGRYFRISKITWISVSPADPRDPDTQSLNPHEQFPDQSFNYDSDMAITAIPSLAVTTETVDVRLLPHAPGTSKPIFSESNTTPHDEARHLVRNSTSSSDSHGSVRH